MLMSLIIYSVIILGVISMISSLIRRRRRHGAKPGHLVALSSDDAVAQGYFFLTLLLSFSFLMVVNGSLGKPIEMNVIVILMSLVAIFSAYYYHAIINLIIGLSGLVGWWIYKASDWTENAVVIVLFLIIFFSIIYLLGRWHEHQKDFPRFSIFFLLIGVCLIGALLFVLSTQAGLGVIVNNIDIDFTNSWQILVTLVVLCLSYIMLAIKTVKEKFVYPPEAMGLISIMAMTFLFLLTSSRGAIFYSSSSYSIFTNELSDMGIAWLVIFNIMIFGYLLGLIILGSYDHKKWFINIGSIGLVLLAIIKYFDWFYSFMDKSVFFLSAGVLLFLVGYFMEKGRKRMLASINSTN